MANGTIKAFYVGNKDRMVITDSKHNVLTDIKIGDTVNIRQDIDSLDKLDGFYLYDGMKRELTGDNFHSRITGLDISEDNGLAIVELNESGYAYPITVLETLQDYNGLNASDEVDTLYYDVEIHEVAYGDKLRLKTDVIIGGVYGAYNNVRYTPEQFSDFIDEYYERHEFVLPGELVTVVHVDTSDNTIYCADEDEGIALWYGVEMLQKPLEEETKKEHNDDFLAFVQALKEVAEFNGIEVPQVDIEEEPNVIDEYLDDSWLFDDDDDLLNFNDDEEFGFPIEERTFYKALEDLKYAILSEDNGSIWVMTDGERALTFKDDRLVDVRLAEHIENFVYYSAPIQMKDLSSRWVLQEFVDEEMAKLNEIVSIVESLKDESLMSDLLETISRYKY